jgi:anti-anti-sigma factor
MLTIDIEKTGEVAIVRCIGRIVRGESVSTLRNTVISGANTRVILLDLSDVEAVDAGGLSAMISLYHWSRSRGVQFSLVNPSHFIHEVLVRTGLDQILEVSNFEEVLTVLREAPLTSARTGHVGRFPQVACCQA